MKLKWIALFAAGGTAYVIVELLYRGRSHISMFVAGGACVLLIRLICGRMKCGLPLRCLAGGAVITVVELITGAVCNLWLGLGVWDYSHMPLNLWGQICPYFFFVWSVLALPAYGLGCLICGRPARSAAR